MPEKPGLMALCHDQMFAIRRLEMRVEILEAVLESQVTRIGTELILLRGELGLPPREAISGGPRGDVRGR